ncbi:MAG TPA: hypothetical protein VFN55_08250 [Solirubrobacteraceae bacterium]|nr:hypothetical protein [Solirubrobacteraceae bacterium]
MSLSFAAAWRLGLAITFCLAILLSVCARAPRQAVPLSELRRLVGCALILYAVGGVASLTDHPLLADFVYGTGILVSALAAWLSRGQDHGEPPDGDEPGDEQPPPEPDGVPRWDWARFEREFRDYTERRQRDPAETS